MMRIYIILDTAQAKAKVKSEKSPSCRIQVFVIKGQVKDIVKLRQGSGKVRQGKARKGKDGER